MLLRKSILFLSLLFCLSVAQASTIEAAAQAYEQQKYAKAQELYESLLTRGKASADLHYNLGNAYFKQNNFAKATLHYEKALALQPNHQDALYNNKVVHKNIKNSIKALPEFFLSKWWRSLANLLSSTTWSMIALLLLWFGAGGIILWMFGNARTTKMRGLFVGSTLLVLAVFPLLFAWSTQYFISQSPHAIVMQEDQDLTAAPESPDILNVVPAATKVEVLETVSRWTKVKIPNGEVGWLNNDVLEKI